MSIKRNKRTNSQEEINSYLGSKIPGQTTHSKSRSTTWKQDVKNEDIDNAQDDALSHFKSLGYDHHKTVTKKFYTDPEKEHILTRPTDNDKHEILRIAKWKNGNSHTLELYHSHDIPNDKTTLDLKKIIKESILSENVYKQWVADNRAKLQERKQQALAKVKEQKLKEREDNKKHLEDRDLHIAHEVMVQVGNHYPDADPFDAIASHLHKKYGIGYYEAMPHLDRAVKKHLGSKSYNDYIEDFHNDYVRDNGPIR